MRARVWARVCVCATQNTSRKVPHYWSCWSPTSIISELLYTKRKHFTTISYLVLFKCDFAIRLCHQNSGILLEEPWCQSNFFCPIGGCHSNSGGVDVDLRSYLRLFVYLFVSFLGQIYSYNVKKRNRKLLETIKQKIREKNVKTNFGEKKIGKILGKNWEKSFRLKLLFEVLFFGGEIVNITWFYA